MTAVATGEPRLSDLGEEERAARFALLQRRLPAVWDAMRTDQPGESLVVLPSVALEPRFGGGVLQAYEERFLFMLLLLRQPRLRMIYVTGRPIDERVVDYHLSLLPGVIPRHARARLDLVAVGDGSARPLAAKLLERPRVLAEIAARIPDRDRCHLAPYATTTLERDIALALGIPLYGTDPRLLPLGTKSSCRQLFAATGTAHPLGAEGVRSLDDAVEALADLRAQRPGLASAIVKLDQGAAGRGNAVVDLTGLPAPGAPGERAAVRARTEAMALEDPALSPADFLAALARGGIVEERITGAEVRSPSVQLRTTPRGELEVLSTHDQLLGGPSGQAYVGCRFPADPAYAATITREASRIGAELGRRGVMGRFAIDFVVVRDGAGWSPYAIELNLRKGGTTHPFLTLQFLTDGDYDAGAAAFIAPSGRPKHLMATDHLEAPQLRGLTVDDLFETVVRAGLHFDPARQTGVVLHMISAVTEAGSLGLTAVGDDAAQADALFRRAQAELLAAADPPPEPPLPPLR